MLDTQQKDAIFNALLIGMALDDAYIYAGLSPEEIERVSEDDALQREWAIIRKRHEFSLLSRLDKIIDKQVHMGKEGATTWALEHMYPRYVNKAQDGTKIVSISFGEKDPATEDTVEIHTDENNSTAASK